MSSYHLNRFLFDLKMDSEAHERATGDLDAALASSARTACWRSTCCVSIRNFSGTFIGARSKHATGGEAEWILV
jgi:hypothetical protein